MEYQQLGTSDLHISRMGFGCMSLPKDEAGAARIIHQAIEGGINYFDTADMYDKGSNEMWVGQAIRSKRSQVVLATKVGNQWRADGSGWDWNPRKEYILPAVEESLRRLQTDYIDLYQLHGGTLEEPIDETIEAFELLKQQGKIRWYGISSIRPNVIREWVRRSHMVSVMMQYSLLDRRPEEACLPLLQEHNIGVLARGSLAGGLLVNKPPKAYLNYSPEQVQQAAENVRSVAEEGRNAAQTAIQFVLGQPAITAAVVGMRTETQLREAVEALGAPGLNEGKRKELMNALPANQYTQHR